MSLQLSGGEERHLEYRQRCVDNVISRREDFEPFIEDDEPFDDYVSGMRKDAMWGGNIELMSLSQVAETAIVVFQFEAPQLIIENPAPPAAAGRELHLSYHGGEHYAAVQPLDPSALVSVVIAGSHGAAVGDGSAGGPSNDEELVMASTLCRNLGHIRSVLGECYNDVDATIEYLIAEQNAGLDWDDMDEGEGGGGDGGAKEGGESKENAAVVLSAADRDKDRDIKRGGGGGKGGRGKHGKAGKAPKLTNKERKALRKKEKEEQAVLGKKGGKNKWGGGDAGGSAGDQVAKDFGSLSI